MPPFPLPPPRSPSPSPSAVTTTAVSITQTDGAPVRGLSGRPVPASERWTAQCPARAARPARPSSSVVVSLVPRSSGPSWLTNRPRRSAGSRPVVAGVTLPRQLHGLLTGRMVRVFGELRPRGALGRVVGRQPPVRGTAAGDRTASYRRFTAACGPFIGRHWRAAPAPCSGSPWPTDGEEGLGHGDWNIGWTYWSETWDGGLLKMLGFCCGRHNIAMAIGSRGIFKWYGGQSQVSCQCKC